MLQFTTEQLLQITMAVSCAALALLAGVFLLIVHATRRRRGLGWFWGWAFLAATFGFLALAQHNPVWEQWLALAATCTAVGSGVAGVAAAYRFRNRPVSAWSIAVLVASSVAALLVQWRADLSSDMLAVELPLMASSVMQAAVLLPLARVRRMSGLQTACAALAVVALTMGRTLLSGFVLALRGEELNNLYWSFEAIGGLIVCFILAIGELTALLDEVRAELEHANDALSQALEGLEVAAKLDPLTGLYNRYAFYSLVGEFSERGKMGGSIAIIDLNGLKRINDTFGHHAGDRALLNTAVRLQEVVRQSDYVFRWGGDEFVALLFGMPPDAARERLTHMDPPAALDVPDEPPVQLSVSWGIAPLESDVDQSLRDADAQLYAQKRLFLRAAERLSNP